MTAPPRIVMYGASGYSFAVAEDFTHGFAPTRVCDVVAFIDDYRGDQGLALHGVPIVSFAAWKEQFCDVPCFVAVADPGARRRLVGRLIAEGGAFAALYDRPELSIPHVTIGAGTALARQHYVGPNTRIGNHVQIMPMCSIGHDVVISDFVTVCPSCTVSGHVVVEDGVFLGAGSTVINGTAERPLIVGCDAKVAAGAVVTKSVRPGCLVSGNPARSMRELSRRQRR
jgi:sugar O-acyltransferase (sialic acid O-acetyltransferase NeuD family)